MVTSLYYVDTYFCLVGTTTTTGDMGIRKMGLDAYLFRAGGGWVLV